MLLPAGGRLRNFQLLLAHIHWLEHSLLLVQIKKGIFNLANVRQDMTKDIRCEKLLIVEKVLLVQLSVVVKETTVAQQEAVPINTIGTRFVVNLVGLYTQFGLAACAGKFVCLFLHLQTCKLANACVCNKN